MPLVVYLRASDDLIEWTGRARQEWGHTGVSLADDLRSMRNERQTVVELLSTVKYRALTLDVSLPLPVAEFDHLNSREQSDLFFDLWASLAEEVASRMHYDHRLRFDLDIALQRMRRGGRA